MRPFIGVVAMISSILFVPPSRAQESVTHYVDAFGANPVSPFLSWANAATSIQDAVDACAGGDVVIVTNGLYDQGGKATPGSELTNRVLITTSVVVRSVNGPDYTSIAGQLSESGDVGTGAVRCVYITSNALLIGFTLTNGHTMDPGLIDDVNGYGGGVYATNAIVSNCIIRNCTARWLGGGVYGGTILDSRFYANAAMFGGGGACDAAVYRSYFLDNSAQNGGAGNWCYMENCLLFMNNAQWGGGAFGGWMKNCTIVSNFAGIGMGSGVNHVALTNCVLYFNSSGTNHEDSTMDYTCTEPEPLSGTGNTTNNPMLVNSFWLGFNSPCIDTALDATAPADDIDGRVRPIEGNFDAEPHADMGCIEYNPQTVDSDADIMVDEWEYLYALNPLDSADADGQLDDDGVPNVEEFLADTIPTNDLSYFGIHAVSQDLESHPVIEWRSVNGKSYSLFRGTNLPPTQWSLISNHIAGTAPSNVQTDQTAVGEANILYRIELDL